MEIVRLLSLVSSRLPSNLSRRFSVRLRIRVLGNGRNHALVSEGRVESTWGLDRGVVELGHSVTALPAQIVLKRGSADWGLGLL